MRFLITAGPTREFLDPVRYISNRSSGKMGYALAEAARSAGSVVLVSGPVALPQPTGVGFIPVTTAQEMADAVFVQYAESDVVIMAAAVCDFRPKQKAGHKLKKGEMGLTLELERTVDVLEELGRRKKKQLLVGFAAETEELEKYAQDKLQRKNLDFIVANETSAFDAETNAVTILSADGTCERLPELSKRDVAAAIIDRVLARRR